MVFSSLSFLYYFLPIAIVVYYLVPKKFKNVVALVVSLSFYFFGEPKYGFLMILSIFVTYIGGILIAKYKKQSKAIMIAVIFIQLFSLVFFKYTDFFITNINNVFKAKISLLNLALPIGISFYTFQMLSYIIDVYTGKVEVQKNFVNLATYVALFPQLIAGPIVRYTTIMKELDERTHTFEKFSNGVRRFIIGLSKKILIANVIASSLTTFSNSEKTTVFYWIYAIGVTLQIYFDFSGYSDMAIGLGKMFGFTFPENFDHPYMSKSVTEFWRRWHMTLGTWFKDYVYIPLGGNRVSKIKWIRNIFIVWFLTGFWHGADWNFIIWGVLYGVLLMIEKLGILKFLEKIPNVIRHVYVMFVVIIGFVIFNGGDVLENILGIFGLNSAEFADKNTVYVLLNYLPIYLMGIIGSTTLVNNICKKIAIKFPKTTNLLEPLVLIALLVICTGYLVDGSFNPFLYFRF